ncbi:MAG: tRNA pseudouridine(55) synthase TruB [Pontibacterium sp.]
MAQRKKRGRAIDGIFLLNKPQGISSNAALQRVKRIYGAAKAGHTGALDPLATGMLPVCLGEATKFSHYLLDADKCYITTATLGIRTDSSDADGQVIEEKPVPEDLSADDVKALLAKHFDGEIEQVPSMFSALKFNGQPLYKLARQGIKVEVKPRKVTIYSIELLDFRGTEIDLKVHCSKGTYIRSIVEDLGLYIGCGAHVSMLHRLDAGPYKADKMITFEQLETLSEPQEENEPIESIQARLDHVLLPPWTAVEQLPRLCLDTTEENRLLCGQRIRMESLPDELQVKINRENHVQAVESEVDSHEEVLLFSQEERFLGIGQLDHTGVLHPKRLIDTA